MVKEELSDLKERALRAAEQQRHQRAGELYVMVAARETADPGWRHRAGECFRKAGRLAQAVEQFTLSAEAYARGGYRDKALAVCKVGLRLDPRNMALKRLFESQEIRLDAAATNKAI